MKIVRPNVPAGSNSGGYVGTPQKLNWQDEMEANRCHWVLLECGCIDDINDRSVLLINAFENSKIYCEKCERFSFIVRALRRKYPSVKVPQSPLF